MCSESIKPAHAPTRAHGDKNGQKEIFSTFAISRIELEISRIRFNRTTQLSQSVLPTWKYALWVGIYTLEVSSLSKMYCRPDSSSGIDLWT